MKRDGEARTAPRREVLVEAVFDPKLRTYLLLQGALVCIGSIVGIVLLPFWLLFGWMWAQRYYEHLGCTLTERALLVKKGIWFRSEATIPLDRIQDVGIRHGPVLDRLGIATIKVETAGASASGTSGVRLTGIVDTAAFRDRVLEARDRAAGWLDEPATEVDAPPGRSTLPPGRRGERPGSEGRLPARTGGGDAEQAALLGDIRDTLGRIERLLADRS